jgi:acetate kinase
MKESYKKGVANHLGLESCVRRREAADEPDPLRLRHHAANDHARPLLLIMHDYALVLNAGSSSLKFSVFSTPGCGDWCLESRGQIEGFGMAPRLLAKDAKDQILAERQLDSNVQNGYDALGVLAIWLKSMYREAQVVGVGHRVVHGGCRYTAPTVVTREVLSDLYRLIPLAPLHQPYNLAAMEAVSKKLPDVPQVACFDTGFHQGRSPIAKVIPLPRECGSDLQRYGFHGLSYEYVASELPTVAPDVARGRIIIAHLGSGASLCALKDGKSIDSTFGFTTLDGLCMGSRPGALDPGVVLYLLQTLGLSAGEVEKILYQKSGLIGISGISSDMRDLVNSDDPGARLAVDYFVYRATKEIFALVGVLGGIDGIVFTAGIGENSAQIRQRICESCSWLGIEIDAIGNACNGPRISKRSSKVSAWVIPTNEELMIARHTGAQLGLLAHGK